MTFLFRAANSNKEYEHKAEFTALSKRIYPKAAPPRWDKSERTLNNFLWFFKFELSFIESEIKTKRKILWEHNTGRPYSQPGSP
jgi:uracil-DNA glycosylase